MSGQLSNADSHKPLIGLETEESKSATAPKKKSLYQRTQDRNWAEISEEEFQKYTGMNKADVLG
ncbi:hypothetical protein CORC01_11404 [Colletotrichum orchidophilum]|uniref:Uncharacterized protein n=1 Tax=Colletotrichum orchidophilum TaxID=1209926 RepID=A0A1G4AVW1_9PEZI|nr:uncharacterized protein CORC01_11404 [Colletotrichum orchidophilum]OHE93261.1 hypothetical protein CORC01_11404 [Colletotrichum orchidophilum]